MTTAALVRYFLRLGALGFGGPIVLTNAMERDLVESRGWFTPEEFRRGLTLAQIAPGPLAAQLAIYLGWARGGVGGATLVALAFVLPSFVIVIALSMLYVRFGEMPWIARAFYGVGAAVVAIIARGAWRLASRTLGTKRLLWVLFVVNAIVTAVFEAEIVWLVILSGIVCLLPTLPRRVGDARYTMLIAPALSDKLWNLAWYFTEAGAFVFGSGLAIVPFLHDGVVDRFGWLSERQFVDAVAVAMITPGPVVITVAFIGYLVAGLPGATVAAIAVFLPCYLLVVIPAPYYERVASNERLRAFVDGVTTAAIGAIAGAVVVLGRRAVIDVPTILIAAAALLVLIAWKRAPEPLVVLAAGVIGVFIA